MRVLHVGWGFHPWRPGGLILYAEDLMDALAERGHEVSYFFSGRHYPFMSSTRLKRWKRGAVAMYEVINPPVVAGLEGGTRVPLRDLSEPRIESAFASVVRETRAEVVHFQELHGLPSSLLDIAADAGVPTLMTLQDYGPLCSTLRLFDADGQLCTRRDVGADCLVRNGTAPADTGHLVKETMAYEIDRVAAALRIGSRSRLGFDTPIVGGALERIARRGATPVGTDLARAEDFQRRRDVNVERLGRVGLLVAQSERVAQIYRSMGVAGERMTTFPFTLRHIERLRPRQLAAPPSPITFATLNGCASPSKGSEVVLGALRTLRAQGFEGRFRCQIFGGVAGAVRRELAGFRGVALRGNYERGDLDGLLSEVDVGLMPSRWEEAFGYTGLEMIAKGIPLIANPLGGIVEYAREGETAWLNSSCSAKGLARIMAQLIEHPEQVLKLHDRLLEVRERIVLPMERHVDAITAAYRDLAHAAGPPRPHR